GGSLRALFDPLAAWTALAPLTGLLFALCSRFLRLGRTLGRLGRAIGDGGLFVVVLVGGGVDHLILARLVLGLRGKDDAEIVLGVLEIILRHHIVAHGRRVTGELDVFFGDMGGVAANLHVRAVALVIA